MNLGCPSHSDEYYSIVNPRTYETKGNKNTKVKSYKPGYGLELLSCYTRSQYMGKRLKGEPPITYIDNKSKTHCFDYIFMSDNKGFGVIKVLETPIKNDAKKYPNWEYPSNHYAIQAKLG